jgi:hypothetical protein
LSVLVGSIRPRVDLCHLDPVWWTPWAVNPNSWVVDICQAWEGIPPYGHHDLVEQVLCAHQELLVPPLVDEDERRGRWRRVVEHPKHVIVEQKGDQEILRMVALDLEAVFQNVEGIP